jgi:hypothetical protein
MWWGRLAFNRMIVDNIKRTIDPDYSRSFQRARDRAQSFTNSSSGAGRATRHRHGRRIWARCSIEQRSD